MVSAAEEQLDDVLEDDIIDKGYVGKILPGVYPCY